MRVREVTRIWGCSLRQMKLFNNTTKMLLRTFNFRQPNWEAPESLLTQGTALIVATGLWVFGYGMLSRRLWTYGFTADLFTIGLILVSIALGVGIALGWRKTLQSWQESTTIKREWTALTQEQMLALTPAEFESYVAEQVFKRQGYKVFDTPHTKDGGIDILLEDEAGRKAIVQCKRYKGTVGSGAVRGLYGTMIHTGAVQAYLATTGRISNDARQWAQGKPIGLMDGEMLEELSKARPMG